MFPSVQAQFRSFNEPFEGSIPYMYLDVLGLVTVGVGNLIDPLSEAVALPFCFKKLPHLASPGAPATPDQIAAEWSRLKSDSSLAKRGHLACAAITELELPDDGLNSLIARRLLANQDSLKKQAPFRAFESWPADAQMALLSMAWAMGPGALPSFHHFNAACDATNFAPPRGSAK